MRESAGGEVGNGGPRDGDGVNLRAWFIGFLLWMASLTAIAWWGLFEIDRGGTGMSWAAWALAGYAFYLSLCCTLFPAPTSWIVLLAAGDLVAAQVGLEGAIAARVLIVATVGAAATGVANLNEYHVFTYLLRHRRVARLRQTRLYQKSSTWFATSPFAVIVLFGFLPIPVDVVRWLAITARYSRLRFYWANFFGRWLRYAVLALASAGLHLSVWHIAGIQAALVVAAMIRIIPRIVRHRRENAPNGGDVEDAPAMSPGPPVGKEAQAVVGETGQT